MEAIQFVNITGKKEVKGYHKEQVIACPTPGEFRLPPKVQAKLGVNDGDFAVLLSTAGDASRVFIGKGIAGTLKTDENGNPIRDKRQRFVYEENTGFGAVLRYASPGSPNLKLTGAAAWNALGGDTNKNKMFSLGEAIEVTLPTTLTDEQGNAISHTTEVYELIFASEEDKMVRGEGTEEEAEQEEAESFSMDAENATETTDEAGEAPVTEEV